MAKILIVDDDPLICLGLAAMLEDLGHTAVEAYSSKEALAQLSSHGNIEVMITDRGMPGMDGAELALTAQAAFPTLPIIFATGYTHLLAEPKPAFPVIGKPFSIELLARTINDVLQSRKRS